MSDRPNFIVIMTDQQRADLCKREGFALDTTPFLDDLATQGMWFNRAYTTMPACLPARVSMLTGRYPSATRARTNHNVEDVTYSQDLVDILQANDYKLGLCGKNHSHVTPDRFDHWFEVSHRGSEDEDRTDDEKAFDAYLHSLHSGADLNPTPFPLETQCAYRAVSAAINWLDTMGDNVPFFLWLSFPEPHNPYQVPEPYFSMFPPKSLPPTLSTKEDLTTKGFKFQWNRHLGECAFDNFDEQVTHTRSNYLGMLRMIDDQVERLFTYLDEHNLRDNTHIVILSDHGDFVGEYGLVRKGPELPEVLTRIPFIWLAPDIKPSAQPQDAFISIADIMPTICDILDTPLPDGTQGRSLLPILRGEDYPEQEFSSIYAEHGFGGLHYTADDDFDPTEDGLIPNAYFDGLNGWSQSGTMRMIRRGDWKLIFDMQGHGQLYNISDDPVELKNLYNHTKYAGVQSELLAELLAWTLRAQDPLPYPRQRYKFKTDSRNYWAAHH